MGTHHLPCLAYHLGQGETAHSYDGPRSPGQRPELGALKGGGTGELPEVELSEEKRLQGDPELYLPAAAGATFLWAPRLKARRVSQRPAPGGGDGGGRCCRG
jgi:hypothetical protein